MVLLELFISHDELSVKKISELSELDISTAFRMLVTLEAYGFVEQNQSTGEYRLGVTCLELGSRFLKNNDIRSRSMDALEALRNRFGETVHLAVLDIDEVVYLEKMPGLYPIGFMSSRVGGRSPAHCTGVGKVLLAFLSEEELEKCFSQKSLQRFTTSTITEWDALLFELRHIREQGFALDREEHEIGVTCVAVPIFNHKGIAAAISVSGPVGRLEEHIKKKNLIEELKHAADEISTNIGGKQLLN